MVSHMAVFVILINVDDRECRQATGAGVEVNRSSRIVVNVAALLTSRIYRWILGVFALMNAAVTIAQFLFMRETYHP